MPRAPYHLYNAAEPSSTPTWHVQGRATQPGFASWWRLLAPQVAWAQAHVRRVSFACLRGASLDPLDPTRRSFVTPTVEATPHRERLITVTRGPMARKKQSRTQLLVRRQVVSLNTEGEIKATLILGPAALGPLGGALRAKARVWAQPLGAPLTLVGGRVRWPVNAAPLLLWF